MFRTSGRKPLTYQFQIRRGVETPAVLTATLQLTDRSSNFLRLDPGAANREVRMPASNRDGMVFWIQHVGPSNNLELRDSTGATIGTTSDMVPAKATICVNEGGTWKHMGIRDAVL